ncbi:uncharacterized protein LOC141544668 isoform X4 [Sminthopsis crassicaudata]|uniref:uncharacterized protein LOC141544668 isoform X4 n=1 Tax=Sminthopsis crassicaudata TaxID=9301 RepID=UPI003D68BC43
MKKIFNFGKKGQSSSSRFNLPSFFGSQPVYRTQGYLIQSKDLGKIHKAALRGDVVKVQQLLLLGKNTVNELDKMKRTPLHLACANGYPDVVSLLIERKCELDLLDNDNKTPLMKAIECQREECATILLEHGADPNLRDSHSNTLLHYIASGGNKFMAEKLIEHKIDIDAKNKEGRTPLMLAISARNIELADFLLKNGANVNAMDDSKRTALMIAVSVGMEALGLVTLLLQHNADHTLQDNDGWIAEKYAKLYGYPVNIYHKQIEDQKKQIEKEKEKIEKPKVKIEKQKEQIEKQKPCTPQISCSDKTSDIAPSLDKKAEDGIVEDSISRFSDNTGSDKAWLSTDDELDFDTKKLPKLNLAKVLNAAHQITKIRGEGSRTVNTEDTAFLRDNQPDNEKDLTDSFSKSSSQAHCSHAVHPSPACFSQSSLMKSTLLDIKEYPTDSEEEAKENDVLVKNDTVKQISHEIPNIPDQLQEKCAERKTTISTLRLEEEEESRWDSECSTENLKGSARHLSSTNQSIKDSIPLRHEAEDGIVEDSISRFSDNTGSDKAWLSTDDELDFDTKKLPKLNLAKVLNAAHQITKIRGEGSRTVNTEDTAFLRDNQPDNEKDLTDSFSKSSSQAHCSHAVHPSPACFSQSSLMKSTLLDIKEYPTDSEEEAKENDVLVKNDTVKQISHEIPNIPDQLQEKCAERKTTISTLRLEEEEESRWDSECSTENLKGSARHLSSTNQSIKDSIPLRHEAEDGIVEDSISRFSDNTGSDKAWLSTDDELDFDTKKLPKLNLAKVLNAAHQITKIRGEGSRTVNTEDTAFLRDNQPDNEKDLTDSFSKSSSQAHCSHAVHPSPACFSQSSLMKSTLLDIKEYPTDSEEEAKENDVLVKNDTVKQISHEIPNIPDQLQEKCAERKTTISTLRLEEEEESRWDSECSTENLKGSARHLSSTNQSIKDSIPLRHEAEDGIVEDSISRFSDNTGSDKAWLSTDDELDFDTKKLPKLNLAKVLNAAHQITKIRGEGSRTVNTEDTAFLRDNQPDNEKDLTDSFSKSSSQAHCSHAVHPSPACFSQSSLMKSTLLDIKEYPTDSEEEAKENDVLVKNDTVKQISHEIPNIPDQLQEKCAERKTTISTLRLEEEEESRWDSECSTENLKGSARHLSSTNQSIKDSIPLRHEDTSSWDSTSPGDKNKNQQSLKVESSKHARKSPSKSSHNHGETTKTTNALFKNEKDTGSGSDPSYKFPAKKPGSEKPCEPPVRQEKEKQPLEDIPSWDSPNISKINDSHKSSRHSKLERKHDCNAAYVAKNIIKADSKVAINGIKEDRSFGTEMTFSQHRNIPSLLQSCGPGSHVQLTLSDNMKSINQDKKAELIKPRKCKKKTKHLETSSQSSLDNDYHSTYEVEEEKQKHQINGMETVEDKDVDKLTENRTFDKVNDQFAMESHQYGKDEENKIPGKKIPIMHISPKKNLAPVQHVSKGLVKNTPNEKNKDEVEMTSYALDDLTQSHNTDTEDYDLPPSNSVQGSPRLQRHQKVVLSCGLSVKHQNKSQLVQMTRVVKNSLQTTVRRSQEKFSKRRKTKSRSNHQKVKCDKEYYRGRLEGKKQNGGKTQSEIETNSSSVSSDILYEEHQPPELHLQREQEEWLLLEDQLIDKIDILSNKLSKAKNELYQRRDSLRMKTSILEKTQKELEMTKDKVKEFELSNHIQKEKLKKSSLKVESMQEKLTQKQREFALLQEISEDAQNKGAFKRRVLKSNWMNFRDRSLTVDASTEKQDHGVEERNKESTDEIIHLREQIRIYENEQAEDEDMIRKLQQELADSQKEESILSQKALEMKQLLKIYQMESEDMIRKLQQELADSQKEESMLSQKALEMKQLLKIYQMESEDMIRKLQQELADSQKEESMLSQKALEMKQLLKIYQMESELQESQEQKRETQQYNELEEHMQKFKMECATFENSGEQDENIWETINFYFKHIQDLKRQLDAAFSKFMQLELMNKIIQEESFSSKSLQKNHDKLERKKRNLKKLMLSII